MNIVHIIPGSGGSFYCENCIRDAALVQALRELGHRVTVVPMYLPLFDQPAVCNNRSPVFYGAVNLYLRQLFPWLRKLPAFIAKWLDRPFFLKWAAARAGSTRAAGLNALTLSMLQGEKGGQAAELQQLLNWLAAQPQPQIIHLSNALLLGLAPELKKRTGAAIICTLQDEHTWLNAMDPVSAAAARQLIEEKAEAVCRFVAVSYYYKNHMQQLLHLPREKIDVVHNGIALSACPAAALPFHPPVIGYLSRITASQGLEILVDAFTALCSRPHLRQTKLYLTGGYTDDDKAFIRRMKKKLSRQRLLKQVVFFPDFTRQQRTLFLRQITVLCVPAPDEPAFGLYLLEALAAGVPVVEPDCGAFPELIRATGGGIIYDHRQPASLEQALCLLLADPDYAHRLGSQGQAAVLRNFSIRQAAEKMGQLYDSCLAAAQPENRGEESHVV